MQKLLIIKPSSLGDIIHSLPFLNAIKEAYPRCEVHWVVAKSFEVVLAKHPMITKLWVIDKDSWRLPFGIFRAFRDLLRLRKEFKKEHFEVAVDLQGLLRSAVVCYITQASRKVGFSTSREFSSIFYSELVQVDMNTHAVLRNMQVAKHLGIDCMQVRFPLPEYPQSQFVKEVLEQYSPFVVLVPGARKPANQWMPERFAEVAKRLPIPSLIIGSKADLSIAESIESLSQGKAVSICAQTSLADLFGIIKSATCVISNDTGPLHIAVALDKPVVAIFGPANPIRTGPFSSNAIVLKSTLACAPCYKRHCDKRTCLKEITVQDVTHAVEKLTGLRVS